MSATAERLDEAGRVLARVRAEAAAHMTPREQAEAAHQPGDDAIGNPSIDEVEARIRARRGLPAAIHAQAS